MRRRSLGWLSGTAITITITIAMHGANVTGQSASDSVDAHIAAARTAAGREYTEIMPLCDAPTPPRQGQAPVVQTSPDRSRWHVEPVKVFDNLYFVGQADVSSWAVTTSNGIILVDTIWNYSVEDEVVEGLRTLGFDPSTIKYAIVSHGHSDHAGGAAYLQQHFGTRILMSAEDWDLVERVPEIAPKPRRDIEVADGQVLTLGDTTLRMYFTPGHTLGTISTIIPVKDHGQPHLAALWGGTAYLWEGAATRSNYIAREVGDRFWFNTYINSTERFRDIVMKAHVDILLSNHTAWDGSKTKLPAMATRKPGDPHPYVVGTDSVKRYLTVAEECAKAGLRRQSGPQPH